MEGIFKLISKDILTPVDETPIRIALTNAER
jgi:hypothetical protein